MEVVIADDLSGAAEIAGIAWQAGKSVELFSRVPESVPDADLVVIDTNTRLLSNVQSAAAVTSICRAILPWNARRIFKKIDSVLRGQVISEIEAAVKSLSLDSALVIPANPSRNRIIRNGQYFIGNTALHETEFAHDPSHPATTSSVTDLLENSPLVRIPSNVRNMSELTTEAASLEPGQIPVGGADFFRALNPAESRKPFIEQPSGKQLWICGSQAIRNERKLLFSRKAIPVAELSAEDTPEAWADRASAQLEKHDALAMELDVSRPLSTEEWLTRISDAVEKLLEKESFPTLFAEGGSTAKTIIDLAGWYHFAIEGILADGVVAIRPMRGNEGQDSVLIIKPGSYSWPF